MNTYYGANYLVHYGMPRRSGRYPWGSGKEPYQHSDESSKKADNSDTWKKVAIGAGITAGVLLTAYGGYQLSKMAKTYKTNKIADIMKTTNLPKDLGGVTNPKGLKNNCKECAEATLKRWLGVDPTAVADTRISGNLTDFCEKKLNPKGVTFIGGDNHGIAPMSNGEDTLQRINRQILRNFGDNQCGMISVSWQKPAGWSELKWADKVAKTGDGHCFNWYTSNGKVFLYDDQPDPPLTDASKYILSPLLNLNKTIEICKITKEAFTQK